MSAILEQGDLLDRVDLIRLDVGRRLDSARRVEMGQFFTPAPVARFMAALSEVSGGAVRLLDPGAGIGSLSAAWIAHACDARQRPSSIHLAAYEADPQLAGRLRHTVRDCAAVCRTAGVEFHGEVVDKDFIRAAVDMLAERPLWESGDSALTFTHAILNPPYRKLHGESDARRALRSVGIETSNLYAAFLWLAFRLLDEGGEMIAITPRSFCNGPYFRPFRRAFLREMAFRRIHLFESRTAAFKDADVLQENVIFKAVKSRLVGAATISSSTGPDDLDLLSREVRSKELIKPGDPDAVIHIVPDENGTRFAECFQRFTMTLDDLDVQVSTGRVVDFRAKDALALEANGKTVPLVYPTHLEDGYVAWPKPGKKPNYLESRPDTERLLVPAGVYVLVKRFTTKEERRRVTAAVCDPARLPGEDLAFENHLNYFHRRGNGLPMPLAKGLAAFLNSTVVDAYFRQFSGHTQVNAADLRSLKYPDIGTLERIGGQIGEVFPDQETIDALIRKETNMAGNDPVKVKRRVEEAQSVLAVLGLPAAQQNERSALTLLALLDLPPETSWSKASAPPRGITPIMDWFAEHYGKRYAPNTRETVRRQTVHQFLEAGLVVANPDEPTRPINSGRTVYQVETGALELFRSFKTRKWKKNLEAWLASVDTLKTRYARERNLARIVLTLPTGKKIDLSPGGQNVLMKKVIEEFCPRFTPGGKPIYVGDTDAKWAYFDERTLSRLGVRVDAHGKMPDAVIHHVKKKWLVLIEAVTSHGPVDGKRHNELKRLFCDSKAGLVFVTAFLDRAAMVKYLGDIAWETEVWVADAPSHLIHFNG
ncbi:MAG TPA: adenine methyltransferase, partial [Planctomycetaceae bacterium]|nr:adenine methyltransferase [Planctomycetaceae bacterium]